MQRRADAADTIALEQGQQSKVPEAESDIGKCCQKLISVALLVARRKSTSLTGSKVTSPSSPSEVARDLILRDFSSPRARAGAVGQLVTNPSFGPEHLFDRSARQLASMKCNKPHHTVCLCCGEQLHIQTTYA